MKRNSPGMLYPIRAAARLAQVSIDSVRAWEKRYGAVTPIRRNGIRLYTEKDIERLSMLRRAVSRGHSIGTASKLPDAALHAIAAAPAKLAEHHEEPPIEVILDAIDRFQYAAADRELRRLASLMTPRDLIHRVALPLLRVAGEQWQEHQLRISQEHMISQLLGNLLGGMTRIYAVDHPRSTILTATLSDDLHEFGLLAAAILTAGAGLGVVHLGPSLPAKEVAYAVKRSSANIVLLSVTNPQDRILREAQLRSLRDGLPTGIEIWLGVNPPDAELGVKGVRILRSFEELERELRRVGGRF
jgi:DNA-binding transcriptional MerR regulator